MLSLFSLVLALVVLLDAKAYRGRGPPAYGPYPPAGWNPYQQHVKNPWKPTVSANPPLVASFYTTDRPPSINSVPGIYECQERGKFYKLGDKWTPEGGCGRKTCVKGGKTMELGCPSVETSDGSCLLTESDLRKPWPLCCPQLKCLSEQ